MKEIFTVGYPRSGNTWLNRLLSDLLCAPLQPAPDMETDYFGVPGSMRDDVIIRKIHWSRGEVDSGSVYYGEDDVQTVFIQRDPRDVAVSAMYYLGVQPDLDNVIRSMERVPDAPLPSGEFHIYHNAGWYHRFVREWMDGGADAYTTYEALHHGGKPLLDIAHALGFTELDYSDVHAVNERQAFDRHAHNYKHSMRKGIIGDWRSHFNVGSAKLIHGLLGGLMWDMEYIYSDNWWRQLEN